MATIQLRRRECKEGALPPLCMVCGKSAEGVELRPHKFAWMTAFVYLLVLLGLIGILLLFLLALLLRQTRTVWTPLCQQHRGYWRSRALLVWIVLGWLVLTTAACIACAKMDAPGWAYGMLILAFFIVLITVAIVSDRSIRPTRIDDRIITLAHVNADFRDELERQRDAEEEEDEREYQERRRQKLRNQRDDDD